MSKEESLLACQRDAYQRFGTCEVLSCEKHGETYEVMLRDSLLYPEGGGQPADRGWIEGSRVLDVQKAGVGVARCTLEKPVAVGYAEVEVDWQRRFEMMQQHSAQHLITALALGRLGYRTVGFHLGEDYAAIELDTPELSQEDQDALLSWVNEEIRAARPYQMRVVKSDEMESLGVRSRGLPEDHAGDIVRLIEIEGIDLNTCGGTHVSSTAELQAVAFLGTERIRGRVRLPFLAGGRLLGRFAAMDEREQRLRSLLTTSAETLVEQVEALQSGLREVRKQLSATEQEVVEGLAVRLMAQEGPIVYHREGGDMGFLQRLAGRCQALDAARLVLLTASEKSKGEGVFLLVGPEAQVRTYGPQVAETLQGKGGGAKGRFQGKAQRIEGREEIQLA
ncbi:MAG: alanyl-tRNA editing protein [Myxococcales bacterium]|nr:alanyl-tRNA editing protein [Myxococcales bacterium]